MRHSHPTVLAITALKKLPPIVNIAVIPAGKTKQEGGMSLENKTNPTHYVGHNNIQPIDLIEAQDLNFNRGNVIKYVCRAGKHFAP